MVRSRIKDIMTEKGITYAALEEQSGLSNQTIARARGEMINECRISTLEIFAKHLGVRIVDLFEDE